jgi:hypothetical protein
VDDDIRHLDPDELESWLEPAEAVDAMGAA